MAAKRKSTPAANRGSSSASARDEAEDEEASGGVNSTSTGAFGLAVDQLAGICGEDNGHGTEGEGEGGGGIQGWALLGLPLR